MPSEIEVLIHAKSYIDALAAGRDPMTDEVLEEDSLLNNVRLTRCFFYVSGVLQKVIDNGGEVTAPRKASSPKRSDLPPFRISDEQKGAIWLADELSAAKFTKAINAAVPEVDKMRLLKSRAITDFLVQDGYMRSEKYTDNAGKVKNQRVPTPSGEREGISARWVDSATHGRYFGIFYNKEAQQFILDNLDEIIGISNGEIVPDLEG
ncbi:MAG: hypothetical protein LBT21_01570 [Oscillospiraceae bacterium]|jgi:hypothetical protein|nr:hypothetical protein [Oscillospiraceae bacterium]